MLVGLSTDDIFEQLTEVHAAFVESLCLDGRLIVFIVNVDWLLE